MNYMPLLYIYAIHFTDNYGYENYNMYYVDISKLNHSHNTFQHAPKHTNFLTSHTPVSSLL